MLRYAASVLLLLSPTSQSQTIQTPNTSVTVEVTDISGAVVAGAFVALHSAAMTCETISGYFGRSIIKLPTDKYELRVTKSGFATYKKLVEISSEQKPIQASLRPSEGGGVEVTKEVSPGDASDYWRNPQRRITFTVLTPDGKPVSDAIVEVDSSTKVTDPKGQTYDDLQLGEHSLWVAKEGFTPLKRQVKVEEDLSPTLSLTLEPGDGCVKPLATAPK